MTTHNDDGQTVDRFAELLTRFEQENPELVAELDLLGMQVDDYLRLSAEYEPRVITSGGTSIP